jgi:hypothetical protein
VSDKCDIDNGNCKDNESETDNKNGEWWLLIEGN